VLSANSTTSTATPASASAASRPVRRWGAYMPRQGSVPLVYLGVGAVGARRQPLAEGGDRRRRTGTRPGSDGDRAPDRRRRQTASAPPATPRTPPAPGRPAPRARRDRA
jgi:hypothetical protein